MSSRPSDILTSSSRVASIRQPVSRTSLSLFLLLLLLLLSPGRDVCSRGAGLGLCSRRAAGSCKAAVVSTKPLGRRATAGWHLVAFTRRKSSVTILKDAFYSFRLNVCMLTCSQHSMGTYFFADSIISQSLGVD